MPINLYNEVLNLWGATATIIPIGAPIGSVPGGLAGEEPAQTTVRTYPGASGLDSTFTYTTARTLWTNQSYTKGFYKVPILRPDGVSGNGNYATAPDNDYWSFNNNPGTNTDKAFSMGWIHKPVSGTADVIFARWDGVREYIVDANNSLYKFIVTFRDESALVNINRASDTAYISGVWHTFAFTYDGSGGASAANGIIMYVDGVAVASTPTNNASYVAMENSAVLMQFMMRIVSTSPMIDDLAGGPFGPIVSAGTVVTPANLALWTRLWQQYGLKNKPTLLRKLIRGMP